MADLLECLLQIKGLRETANRVAALPDDVDEDRWQQASADTGATPLDLLSALAESEQLHATWLRIMLTNRDRVSIPKLPPSSAQQLKRDQVSSGAGAGVRDAFLRQREANLERLDRCSAEDLSRTGTTPDGHAITVADLVARMLANDADVVGALRRMLR